MSLARPVDCRRVRLALVPTLLTAAAALSLTAAFAASAPSAAPPLAAANVALDGFVFESGRPIPASSSCATTAAGGSRRTTSPTSPRRCG